MTEPTPPPERPLSDEARARIRGGLLQHAHEHRSTMPRWVVPAGAAAAVALVAGLSYWAINPGSTEPGGLPFTGDGTATAPPTPLMPGTTSPSDQGTGSPTPSDASPPATPKSPDTVQVGTRSCEEEMENVLKGASLALQVDDTSSFWVKGEKFVLCDELHGRTTIHQALPLSPRDDVSTYAVATNFLNGHITRSAGGIVPPGLEGVFDVAYTFPDGHTERGTKSTDDQGRTWWRMIYTYDEARGSELKLPEIEVAMRLSGVQKDYILGWGMETCAQANHGC
jgi:hypothetical protein